MLFKIESKCRLIATRSRLTLGVKSGLVNRRSRLRGDVLPALKHANHARTRPG